MKCTSFLVFAVVALITVEAAVSPAAAGTLRGLQSGQVTSLNGVHAGEEILAAVNKITPNVDGDTLKSVATQMAADKVALTTADDKTKNIGAALKQAVAQLFPSESFADVLKRVLPLIQATK